MKDLPKIVTKERFINAFNICKDYCEKTDNIIDVNFRLIKTHILDLTEQKVETFYEKYVVTELIFALPELHSCEKITIPKNSTGTREYRYFSTFSMILYNAIGLSIIDTCYDAVGLLSFNEKSIYPYYPTKFSPNVEKKSERSKWKVSNDYRTEYKKYFEKLQELTKTNCSLLQIDITQYFESIVHEKLIRLVYEYSNKSSLTKNGIDSVSQQTMEFYFESLMLKRFSIPQGRKNFVSDYFGYFYLIPLDMSIKEICSGFKLSFKGMVRYVDDITIIFENPQNINTSEVFRELLVLESKIINWILSNLGLNVNSNKTVRKYLENEEEVETFIEESQKSVSGVESEKLDDLKTKSSVLVKTNIDNFEEKFKELILLLEKFKFPKDKKFYLEDLVTKSERENLKLLYNKGFQNYLLRFDSVKQLSSVLETLDVELTVDHINILVALFLLKNKEGELVYKKPVDKFLSNNLNPRDKRHIHIIHILLSQRTDDSEVIFEMIKKLEEDLINDNYGKYLLTFAKNEEGDKSDSFMSSLDDDLIYYDRLCSEYVIGEVQSYNHYLFSTKDEYQNFIKELIKEDLHHRQALTDQLKNYVLYRRLKKWDLAFNCFHNFFHELVKIKLDLYDNKAKPSNIGGNIAFSLEEQLTINKFYSCRNFNSISHPSKDSIPAKKADQNDLDYFESRIINILFKLLKVTNAQKL